MKVWGNLLHLAPHFRFSKNLKVQILEICPSAQEFAIFTYIIDLKKIFTAGQRWPAQIFEVINALLNLQEDEKTHSLRTLP